MKDQKPLVGIGGWLALLVISLMLGPLGALLTQYIRIQAAERNYPLLFLNPVWTQYKTALWTILGPISSISFAAGYLLWRVRRPSSVMFAIIALWIAGPFGSIASLVAAALIFGDKAVAGTLPRTMGGIPAAIFQAFIWTAYLLESKRVTNTFGQISREGAS